MEKMLSGGMLGNCLRPLAWLSLLRDKSALPAPPGLLALLPYDSAQY